MVRVLQSIRQGKIGGGERHVLDLVRGLDRQQFEPVVLSFSDGPMVEELRSQGVPTFVIPTRFPFNPLVVRRVRQLIEREGIQLVHAHGSRAASNLYQAATKLNVPMLYTVHGWSFHPSLMPWMFKLRHQAEGFLTDTVDLTINVSLANQREGRQFFPLQRSEIVYYGVDTERFDPDLSYPDLRQELSIPEDRTLVGFVARMTVQKDPLSLVEAIRLVVKQTQNVHFLLVGDGELRFDAESKVKEYGLEEWVTFTGFRQDVPTVLANLDVYVLPSLWEGLSIAMLEALSMGKTVLASSVDGNVEAVSHEQNGLLIAPQDPETLAQAILRVHADPDWAARLGQAARQTVLERFSLPVMVKNTEAVYRQLLAQQVGVSPH